MKSEQYFRDKIEIFICLFDEDLLAILKVTDARRDVILAGGLYHRFPWSHLFSPPGIFNCCELRITRPETWPLVTSLDVR